MSTRIETWFCARRLEVDSGPSTGKQVCKYFVIGYSHHEKLVGTRRVYRSYGKRHGTEASDLCFLW
jgi:hypothetical protein